MRRLLLAACATLMASSAQAQAVRPIAEDGVVVLMTLGAEGYAKLVF